MSGETPNLLNDTNLWYGVAFLIVVGGIYFKGRKPIAAMLDAEIAKVRHELDEAKRLRAEADATLAEYKKKQQEALQEAANVIAKAREGAAQLRAKAEADLKAQLARHEQKALDRIKSAEEAAIADVRRMIMDQAMETARANLSKMDASIADKLVDQAISDAAKLSDPKVA